jgi:hypothetical protein
MSNNNRSTRQSRASFSGVSRGSVSVSRDGWVSESMSPMYEGKALSWKSKKKKTKKKKTEIHAVGGGIGTCECECECGVCVCVCT